MPTFTTTVDGRHERFDVDGHERAVDVLRDDLGHTGPKLVCGSGVCGACTVLVDGTPTVTCILPGTALRDRAITTVAGVGGPDGGLHPVQRAFLAFDALQCGYCTPGFVVDAVAFVDAWRAEHGDVAPDEDAVAHALSGHLCRCGAYAGIRRAVAAACRGEHDTDDGVPADARVDGPAKVTGHARYTTDVTLPEMLEATIRRSPVAAARVAASDLDVPDGAWAVGLLDDDRRVRWAGQPMVAVAAPTRARAREVAAGLDVALHDLPAVVDPTDATADDAPLVYDDDRAREAAPSAGEGLGLSAPWRGNQRGPVRMAWRSGTARRRINAAHRDGEDRLVAATFTTDAQLHTSFEPHACVAHWIGADEAGDRPRLRLWVSTQAVVTVVTAIADELGLDPGQVDVVADHVGGGFGSKLDLGTEVVAAARLSRASGRPVRLVLDRREELTATGNRPGATIRVALLGDTEGLEAMVVESHNHAGTAVESNVAVLATTLYGRGPREARDTDVVTNAPPGKPFRGPGAPTMAWAVEQAVDAVARRLDVDPIDLRRSWDGHERRHALYDWAAALPTWQDRPHGEQTGRFRRGVGVAAANWFVFEDPATEVEVAIVDGRLVATTSSQDMGTGSRTVVARAVASVFDVAPHAVEVRLGRSGGPHGPPSGGSRTTTSLWPAAHEAATRLHARTGGEVSTAHDGASARAGRPRDTGWRPVPMTVQGLVVGRGYSAAVHVSEVEVDTRTGRVRVLRVHGGIAAGRIHAPAQARSQCEGGIIQGIGLALYEQQVLDPVSGLTLSSNLEDYRIPQLGDVPDMDVHFHEEGFAHVAGGGVGLGEVSTIAPAASIGNAVRDATGWRPTALPMTPARVLAGLGGSTGSIGATGVARHGGHGGGGA